MACATTVACAHVPAVTGADDGARRVVIGRVVVDGSQTSDWVGGGTYSGSEIVIDDHLTVQDGAPVLRGSRTGPGEPFLRLSAHGGPVRFGAGAGPVYVLGIRVTKTLVALTTSAVFPVLVRIPERAGDCDYVGTIHVRRQGDTSWASVADDFDRDAADLARTVHGCTPTKNLAAPIVVKDGAATPIAAAAVPSSNDEVRAGR